MDGSIWTTALKMFAVGWFSVAWSSLFQLVHKSLRKRLCGHSVLGMCLDMTFLCLEVRSSLWLMLMLMSLLIILKRVMRL